MGAPAASEVSRGGRDRSTQCPSLRPTICPNAGAADLGALDLMRDFWGLASRHSIGGDHDATTAHVSRAWHDPGLDVVSVRRGAERAGGYRLGSGRLLAGPVARIYQPDYVSDFAASPQQSTSTRSRTTVTGTTSASCWEWRLRSVGEQAAVAHQLVGFAVGGERPAARPGSSASTSGSGGSTFQGRLRVRLF